jgi:hypothetical protein
MKYGIIFWGNSIDAKDLAVKRESCENNEGTKSRISCKPLFKALEILTLPSCYYYYMTFWYLT